MSLEEAVVTGFCDKKIMDNHAVLDLYKEGYIFISESKVAKMLLLSVQEYVL